MSNILELWGVLDLSDQAFNIWPVAVPFYKQRDKKMVKNQMP